MKSFHPFISTKLPVADTGIVSSANWNDLHPLGSIPTPYSASGIVPTSVDLIRASGGGGGIQLTLTPGAVLVQALSGAVQVFQTYLAMKVDSGVGAVQFIDPAAALFNGAASYSLTDQWQWAFFAWNGASWDVFGN